MTTFAPTGDFAADYQAALNTMDIQLRRIAELEADITEIGNTMMAAAEDHGFCETYDAIVSALNRRITVELPERTRDCRFTTRITLDLDVRVDLTKSDFDQLVEDGDYDLTTDQIRSILRAGATNDHGVTFDVIETVYTNGVFDV